MSLLRGFTCVCCIAISGLVTVCLASCFVSHVTILLTCYAIRGGVARKGNHSATPEHRLSILEVSAVTSQVPPPATRVAIEWKRIKCISSRIDGLSSTGFSPY